MADSTNNVTKDWNSVLSTAQAGLTSTQSQIKTLEAQAAPLRETMNSAKAAWEAQTRFYNEALQKYQPNPVYSEILPLKDAYEKDPTNPAKKAAWEAALKKFNEQVAIRDREVSGFPGIIQGLYNAYSNAMDRYNAVWKQLPPLYEKEAQYKTQISQAQSSLGTQAKGTTPATTSTVSATTVPASTKPGNASVATTTTTTTTIQSSNKSSETVTKTTTITTGSDPAAIVAAEAALADGPPLVSPSAVTNADLYTPASVRALEEEGAPLSVVDQAGLDALTADLNNIEITTDYAALYDAESKATQQDQANFAAKEDWRVRLSLAPGAEYLYNAKDPGILKPLSTNGGTDGVVFPYTPQISVNYAANYEPTNITHSNYKIFQYSGSAVDQITITCNFTAQDEYEANYLLAVIHFFRSMTKMFYGQDENPKNGTPPPLCYMFGMGGYQFAAHPLAISGFSYNLPDDVDYIKTTSESPAGAPIPSTANPSEGRLAGTGVGKGGTGPGPDFKNNAKNEAVTWVPTRIQMSITCVPIMSRNAISNRFSLRDYASGKLVLGTKQPGGGMW